VQVEVPDEGLQEGESRAPGTPGAGVHLRERPRSPPPGEGTPAPRTPFRKFLSSGKDQQGGSGGRERETRQPEPRVRLRSRSPRRGDTKGTDTISQKKEAPREDRKVKLTPMDPGRVKDEIATLKKQLEVDAKRVKRSSHRNHQLPRWLVDRQKSREAKIKQLETYLA